MGKPKHKWQQARQLSLVLASQRHAPESEHKPWNSIADMDRYGTHKKHRHFLARQCSRFRPFSELSERPLLWDPGPCYCRWCWHSNKPEIQGVKGKLLGLSQLRLCIWSSLMWRKRWPLLSWVSLSTCDGSAHFVRTWALDIANSSWIPSRSTLTAIAASALDMNHGHWIHSGDVLRSRNANLSVVPAHSVSQRQPLIWWVTGWVVHTCQIQVIPISKTRTRCYSKSLATSNMSNMSNMSNIYKMEPMAPMESLPIAWRTATRSRSSEVHTPWPLQ